MTSGGRKLRNNGGCFSEENPPLVSFSALTKRMQVIHKGRRYWAFGPMTDGRKWVWRFWSDHKYPWFSGSVTLRSCDRAAAARAFLRWLPFETEVEE